MTKLNLDELQALADAATPGPFLSEEIRLIGWPDRKVQDSEYAAAALNAVPELIAEVRRLEAEPRWPFVEGVEWCDKCGCAYMPPAACRDFIGTECYAHRLIAAEARVAALEAELAEEKVAANCLCEQVLHDDDVLTEQQADLLAYRARILQLMGRGGPE